MSKSSDAKVQITRYFASVHYGICHGPLDYISEVIINEKTGWEGRAEEYESIFVENRKLFGGDKKEGGISGFIDYLPGDAAQTIPELLAGFAGKTTATMPAYRGIASAWFHSSHANNQDGFYWTANNPYLPGVWIKVTRSSIGLPSEFAMISRADNTVITTFEENFSDELDDFSVYLGSGSGFTTPNDDYGKCLQVAPGPNPNDGITQPIGNNPFSSVRVKFKVTATDADDYGVMELRDSDGLIIFRFIAGRQDLFDVLRRPHVSFTDSTSPGVPIGPSSVDEDVWYEFVANYDPDSGSFEVTITNLDTSAVFGTTSIEVSARSPISNLIFRTENGFGSGTVRYDDFEIDLVAGGEDSNPAHIIYECLTNVSWGMGSPESAIDTDSFLYAAEYLYGESFGLSMIWTKQTSIESFVSEILDHIEATLFVSPLTGLITLKLIRDDYSLSGLPEFTPDNSKVTKFSRKMWGETINEIVVTWTNPENEQEETVVAQDLANIEIQGGIVSDGRNYYGVRVKSLAMELAQRDLRSASTPLASCDIEIDRTAWSLLPGDVVILNSPEDGIESILMRVGPVDYGRIGDSIIRASLVEDVFSLPLAEYSIPPDTSSEDPSEDPSPVDDTLIFTLPYYWTVTEIAPIVAPEHPEVFAGVFASEEGFDANEYELLGEVTNTLGEVSYDEIGTKHIVARATLPNDIPAEAETIIEDFPDITQGTPPQVAGFMMIEGADETEHELCLITAHDGSPLAYTFSRGVLDTVPRAWPAGTPVWFIDIDMVFADNVPRSDAEVVNYKMLIQTSLGTLDEADAPVVTQTLTGRPYYPSRPADITVNGTDALVEIIDLSGVDPIPTSFARRNRLTEDSVILAWGDGDVTPEVGQTSIVRLRDIDDNILHEYTGIAATTQNVDPVEFEGNSEGYLEFAAERDGFESLQAYKILVALDPVFEFEDGEYFEFEDNQFKLFEG